VFLLDLGKDGRLDVGEDNTFKEFKESSLDQFKPVHSFPFFSRSSYFAMT